jgi:hypothetical protein
MLGSIFSKFFGTLTGSLTGEAALGEAAKYLLA